MSDMWDMMCGVSDDDDDDIMVGWVGRSVEIAKYCASWILKYGRYNDTSSGTCNWLNRVVDIDCGCNSG